MKKYKFTSGMLANALKGMLLILALTIPLWLIGRDVLGDAVICLLYLAPIAWSASKWGQLAGMSAALTAALCFDFLFIPPFYTFAIGSLEGWLVLAIFLGIAIVVVGRIQESFSQARQATFMYELSSALANARTQDAVARIVARYIRQLFQASRVVVTYQPSQSSPALTVREGEGEAVKEIPDRILPIMNSWGLVGEIQIWQGEFSKLPAEDSLLFQNFATQAAKAFERTQLLENEQNMYELSHHAVAG
jgi:K+-sensing histidine kinase KdpD